VRPLIGATNPIYAIWAEALLQNVVAKCPQETRALLVAITLRKGEEAAVSELMDSFVDMLQECLQ
jgi:hypothetical protein